MRLNEAEYQQLIGAKQAPKGVQTPRYTTSERAFIKLLTKRKRDGAILDWLYRPFTLHIDDTAYQPRFAVLEPDGLVLIELREPLGALEDNPEWKCRAAARKWPKYDWLILAQHGKGFRNVWWPEGKGEKDG